jgi:SSS family solute:Na+ symporter
VTPTLTFLIGYSALMVAVGLWVGRRRMGGSDFFVAGRRLGPALLFSTFLAANIGAGSTVGATALAYREGLSAWWWNGAAGIGSLVLAFTVGPRIWRQASRYRDLTVGDFLERHYGRSMRGLVGALIWVGTLWILAAQLLGIAAVLNVAGGLPIQVGFVVGALVTVLYFVAGGLLTSSAVNAVQLVVILAGFIVVSPLAVAAAGGWTAVTSGPASRMDLFASGPATGWKLLFLTGLAFVVSPGLLQKAYGARDERAVTKGIALNGVAQLVFACAPVAIGMSAAVLYPALARNDLALPTVLSGLTPAVGGLALAAVFSAEVSSADAVLFMLATSASRDLYRGFVNPLATDAQVVRVARLSAAAGAVLGIGLATMYQSVVGALQVFYSLLVVTLFVPVIAALYVRGVSRREGLASVLVGVPVLVFTHVATAGVGWGAATPVVLGVAASGAAFALLRAARR